jgi:phosphatidylserine/phosphatidylglycerophosphate/cardiolipin synthase-like enzyme
VADPAVIGRLKSDKCGPTHWFLIEKDPTEELPGYFRSERNSEVPRNQLFSGRSVGWSALLKNQAAKDTLEKEYTSGNEVTALIDGDAFMSDLDKKLSALGGAQGSDDLQELEDEDEPSGSGAPNDFILITGWEFWLRRTLSKRVAKKAIKESSNSLRTVLEEAVKRGAELRVLSFDNGIPIGVGPRTREFVEAVNKFSNKSACLTKPVNPFMSHHQKEVFIGRKDFRDSWAYVGGMDLAIDRWDTTDHNQTEEEDRNFGWHDIQVKVRGEAALQLWANFAERWMDARNEKGADSLRECPVPNWKWSEWGKQKPIGNQHIQVLRTVAIASTAETRRKRFMGNGERTVLCGLRKAISKAESYIYIEEQFLWDCDLADFIHDQMKNNKELKLIIVMTAGCELPGPMGDYAFHLRHEFLKRVMRVGDKDPDVGKFGHTRNVYPYGLFQKKRGHSHQPIYVHSKLVIIDDRYAAVGSANFDSRSLYVETEVTLGIVDGDIVKGKLNGKEAPVCKFAKKLREDLWQEHLGVTNLGSDDPIEALKNNFPRADDLDMWPDNASDAKALEKHHVRCYIDVKGNTKLPEGGQRLLDRGAREWKDPSGGVEHV